MLNDLHTAAILIVHYVLTTVVIWRVLLRDVIAPPVRLAWIMVVALVPFAGVTAYLLFGEVRLRRADRVRAREVDRQLRRTLDRGATFAAVPEQAIPAFAMGEATSGLPPVAGNRATLLPEDDSAIDDMVQRIDAATATVHALFYIWLPDGSGTRMAEAAMGAA